MLDYAKITPKIPREVALRLSLAEHYIKHVKQLIREDHTLQSRDVIYAIAASAHKCLSNATSELAVTDSVEKYVDFIKRVKMEPTK